MDSFLSDAYSSYSGSPLGSAPRTPSPNASSDGISLPNTPAQYKLPVDLLPPKSLLVSDAMADEHQHGIPPEGVSPWQSAPQSLPGQYATAHGSLLGELYEHDLPPQDQPIPDVAFADHQPPSQQWHHQYAQSRVAHLQQDVASVRRATFPYVRTERDDLPHYSLPPFLPQEEHRSQQIYAEPLSMLDQNAHPALNMSAQDQRHHSFPAGPFDFVPSSAPVYNDQEPRVKLEEVAPVIVPSQVLYRPPSMDQLHTLPYIPHPPMPVQHTDDAASKETQYLRRRCFNCHQTEPPSWRRSTLNPGKIVCNKCGLYERTHLRPRPNRFDELRTGNKSRKKGTKMTSGTATTIVKQEALEAPEMTRRSSVSSSSSSLAGSDWDDSASVASSSSAPPSSFGSPAPSHYSPPEHVNQSPSLVPRDGGIRLPNVDIASLSMGSPRPSTAGVPQSDYFVPRPVDVSLSASLPGTPGLNGSPALVPRDISEANGWPSVESVDASQRRPSVLCKTVLA